MAKKKNYKNQQAFQKMIKKKYEPKFQVDLQEHFPKKNHIYRPDVVLRKNDKPKYIIEIEGNPIRKALIGACILADHLLPKTDLIFVVDVGVKLTPEQFKHVEKRINIAKGYCKKLKSIRLYRKKCFMKLQLR